MERKTPILIYITSRGMEEQTKKIQEELTGRITTEYHLEEVFIDNWDRELTPWAIEEEVLKGRQFTGEGKKTLAQLETEVIPALFQRYPSHGDLFLIGYSLAGLFALWSAYESSLFAGVACCSGSLWYPGWTEYASSHHMMRKTHVFLSLGDKEERTKHPDMQKIGEAMRLEHSLLLQDPLVPRCELSYSPGGHFTEVPSRIVKAMEWFLS